MTGNLMTKHLFDFIFYPDILFPIVLMPLPFFFEEELSKEEFFPLSEQTAKHIQVLRMREGDRVNLTDGKGKIITAEIISDNKKATEIKAVSILDTAHNATKITIAISLIKNAARFEWFLEKATEIGVSEIIPLICERTEKQHFRYQRMKSILISAMLQSQQAWLPLLSEPVKFKDAVKNSSHEKKYIAHCIDEEKEQLSREKTDYAGKLILIGPEGDFTKEEVDEALRNNFTPVSLGNTRLRSETAGIVACVLLNAAK